MRSPKRDLLAVVAAAALTLTLTACGGEDEPAAAPASSEGSTAGAEDQPDAGASEEAASDDEAAVMDVAERFFAGLAENDYQAVCELIETPEYDSVEACVAGSEKEGGSSEEDRAQMRTVEITGSPQITGDTATIPAEQLTFERDGQRANAVAPATLRKDPERGWVMVFDF